MRTLIVAALFAAAVPAPCLGQAEGAIARPEVKVGDRWTYRRMDYWMNRATSSYELRVTFVNDKSILAVASEAGGRENDASYTADWNATVSAFDQAVISPHTGLLHFPLPPGASYRTTYQIDSTNRGGETGARALEGVSSSRLEYKVKVVGWEEVVVPAGRFRALRIEASGDLQRLQGVGPAGPASTGHGFSRTIIWYVPEVKRWVKYLYEDSVLQFAALVSPNDKFGEELVEFKLQ